MFSANTSQVSNDVKYIEDFFSAWLRTGTGSSQTVTTGIKENTGALVISKSRSAATDWAWYDTFRGATKDLVSNSTAAETTQSQGLTAFNTDGHTWGTLAKVNTSGATYVDFVLKPTPKFFDVVTWTGDGTTRAIPHSLASSPGCIIIKNITSSSVWLVNHVGLSGGITGSRMFLNTTDAQFVGASNITAVSDTTFTVISTGANQSGQDYVAYLFAHNAGGFGLTGTDNVISCGSFTTDGSGFVPDVNLGYEPQWVLIKQTNAANNWYLLDTMRNWSYTDTNWLAANLSSAEAAWGAPYFGSPTPTGFKGNISSGVNNGTFIYIAIRRGPMKTPTSGTSVFVPIAQNAVNPSSTVTTNFPVDLAISGQRSRATDANTWVVDRLRGSSTSSAQWLQTSTTNAEQNYVGFGLDSNTGYTDNFWGNPSGVGTTSSIAYWMFRRAPGFFDEVCYTGNSSTNVQSHNLTVVPELVICKSRSVADDWQVLNSFGSSNFYYSFLNYSDPNYGPTSYASGNQLTARPTATTISFGNQGGVNSSGTTYVAYLFASCPGVSKVGSYTGNGSSQTINCGFTGGARFVMIKRTDSTGDWYVWDTARGIVSANDPRLSLNSTAAEVTTDDSIDPDNSGFIVNQVSATNINVSSATYIYLAIA